MHRGESRDFNDFELGDNVGVLGDYVLPEVAAQADLALEPGAKQPDLQALDQLEALLRAGQNASGEPLTEVLEVGEAAGLVRRSGICKKMNRSLWNDHGEPSYTALILAGDTPYAFNIAARRVLAMPAHANTIAVAGNRVMDGVEDKRHPLVQRYRERYGEYPTEYDYMCGQFVPALHDKVLRRQSHHAAFDVIGLDPESATRVLDEVTALEVVLSQGSFKLDDMAVANIAGRGLEIACDLHRTGQELTVAGEPEYDFDLKYRPQVFVRCGEVQVAQTAAQLAQPERYLNPYEGLRRITATARALARVGLMYPARRTY
jgi:hypothetical protein